MQVYGRRYNCHDEEMAAYRSATRMFSEACSPVDGAELDAFPWLRHFPHNPLRKMRTARDFLDSFIDKELAKVKVCFSYFLRQNIIIGVDHGTVQVGNLEYVQHVKRDWYTTWLNSINQSINQIN